MGKTTNPLPSLNKRRGPVTRTSQPELHRSVLARPNNFSRWWDWALEQADAAHNDPPIRIHDEDRPVEHDQGKKKCPRGPCWFCAGTGELKVKRGGALIVGWPFSAQFERFTAGKHNEGPMALTLRALRNPRGNNPHEYRILWALLQGHDDPQIVRALVGGCRQDFFEAASIRAFELVHERIAETLGGVT